MAIRIKNITFDCADPFALVGFWSGSPLPEAGSSRTAPPGPCGKVRPCAERSVTATPEVGLWRRRESGEGSVEACA